MSMSTHYPNFSGTSGLGSVFKSFAKSLKSSSSSHTTSPILVNPKVVGGGADQHVLFNQLSGGSTLQVRASAAVKMSDSLNKYAISSIPEIWYSARDLCEVKNNPQIRRTAVQLLLRCIEQDNSLSTSVRLVYFGDIARYCQNTEHKLDPDFDIFLQALKQLTNDGRDIYDLTVYNPELNLVSFIDKNLNLLGEIYQRSSGNGASNGVPLSPLATATTVTTIQSLTSSVLSSQQQHGDGESTLTLSRKALLGLIQFTRNCLKFNFNAIEENPLATVMINIFTVGVMSCLKEQQQIQSQQLFRTSTQIQQQLQQILALNPTLMQKQKLVLATSLDVAEIELIRLCTELVHSVVLFGHIPTQCFSQAIEFLCCSYPICTEIVWETVTNLSESGSYLVLSGLTDILQNDELQRMKEPISRPVQSCIGAIELLERIHIVKSNENRSSIEYIFFTLFKATQTNFLYNVPILVTCYLKSLNRLFLEEHSRKFERLFPFLVWNATTLSAFEILKSVVLNSKEDEELWRGICDKLQVLYEKHHVLHTPRDKLVDFFMYQHQLLNEDNIQFVFNFYSEERLCVCHANPQWRQNSFKLLSYFYYNDTTSSKIKINTLKLLQNSFNLLIDIMDLEIVIDILRRSQSMNDTTVLVFLKIFLIKQVLLKFLMQNYSEIISIFKKGITDQSEEFTSVLTEAFCEIFVVTSTNDPPKAESTYELLIYLCKHCLEFRKWKLLLTLSRCLVRMRSTMEGYFYFTTPKEMDGLSTAVGRNKNAPSYIAYPDHRWVYPEQLDYLPEEYFNQPNKYLNTQTNIDINEWFQIVLDIMQNFIGWEVYTFIWAHFCPQLSNLKLFLKSESQILKLRSIVCDQLTLNFPQGIEIPSRTTKPDLQVMFVRTLSGLMGYHTLFSKHDEDLIINALIFGLVSWEKTAIPCIHILTVCCYETPLSIKKFLSLILTKLQTRTSSSLAASPTLEFLLSLTHLETLTSNFTLDEFRRVFAIAFKFIQYYKDKSSGTDNEVENEIYQVHGVDAEVDDTPLHPHNHLLYLISTCCHFHIK